MTREAQIQAYDNVIKRLFERHAEEAIPLFLEEKELAKDEDKKPIKREARSLVDEVSRVEELNIEALIPPRRNDRVYRSPYKGRMHIVEVEIETAPNGMMAIRSLIYHSLLMEKYYGEVIMSMILYPFKMPIARSPLEETNGNGEALKFHFRVLPLWRFDARVYFERGIMCMYAFLPAMGGATKDMLLKAIERMVEYYREKQDDSGLREEFLAFSVLLRRAAILPPEDIEEVTQKMVNYDPFLIEDPHFGAIIRAKAEEAAREAAREAATSSLKNALFHVIEMRFPALASSLDQGVLPQNPDELDWLIVKVATASNEQAVRQLLGLTAH